MYLMTCYPNPKTNKQTNSQWFSFPQMCLLTCYVNVYDKLLCVAVAGCILTWDVCWPGMCIDPGCVLTRCVLISTATRCLFPYLFLLNRTSVAIWLWSVELWDAGKFHILDPVSSSSSLLFCRSVSGQGWGNSACNPYGNISYNISK